MSNVVVMNGHGLKVIKTEYKQRKYDMKWQKLIKIADLENRYSYKDASGNINNITPTKWICAGVFDYRLTPTKS